MTTLYMLDSDTSSFAIRQNSRSVEERLGRLRHAEVCISIVTRAEILFGLKRLPPESRLHDRAAHFLAEVSALSWDEAAAERYTEIRFNLQRQGTPIGSLDTMIAAHAMSVNAVLVTNNLRHFERVGPELKLENWYGS